MTSYVKKDVQCIDFSDGRYAIHHEYFTWYRIKRRFRDSEDSEDSDDSRMAFLFYQTLKSISSYKISA
jgi:hypothetical protein